MTDDPTPIDGQTKANVTLVTPRQTAGFRSAVTARPEARLNGNSPAGRRVRDLFKALMTRLDNPTDITIQAAVLALSELLTAAENARADLLEGKVSSSNELVRLENLVRRAEARVGLVPAAAAEETTHPYAALLFDEEETLSGEQS
jgi:hypothetical protein